MQLAADPPAARQPGDAQGALVAAAGALPITLLPLLAGAADVATFGVNYLHYKEADQRMTVREPVIWLSVPFAERYEVSAHATVDVMSGASPRIVSNQTGAPVQTLTGASIRDRRRAGDIKLLRRFDFGSVALSRAESHEKDYHSHAFGVEGNLEFNDKNTVLSVGMGRNHDRVGSEENASLNERRDVREWLFGVTQVLSPRALVQSSLQWSRGSGYYNDPYKFTLSLVPEQRFPVIFLDSRPAARNTVAWLTRYRHFLAPLEASLRAEYRYFRDSWGVRGHTVEVGWTQSLGESVKLEPALRYYAQSRASFYAPLAVRGQQAPLSSDQRLAAFGSVTPMMKLSWAATAQVTLEASVALMRQRSTYRLGGSGSSEFAGFDARWLLLGATYRLD